MVCRKVPEDRAGGVPRVHVPAVLVPAPQAMPCTQQKIASVLMFESFLVSKEVGGWGGNVDSEPTCYRSSLGSKPDIPKKTQMGDISKGVANTLVAL